MDKRCVVILWCFFVSFITSGYVVAEVASPTSGGQQAQMVLPGFDIRKQMIERGEIQIYTQPRVGLKAAKIPEAALQAASQLAQLPGKEFTKSSAST